eukprot:237886-Hanusia_phi.AAC.6
MDPPLCDTLLTPTPLTSYTYTYSVHIVTTPPLFQFLAVTAPVQPGRIFNRRMHHLGKICRSGRGGGGGGGGAREGKEEMGGKGFRMTAWTLKSDQ